MGSAEDESRDQVLEEVLVGPVPVGTNKFVFQVRLPPGPAGCHVAEQLEARERGETDCVRRSRGRSRTRPTPT